jgi:hypothetical protein
MPANSSGPEHSKHRCGTCARFKIPDSGCPWTNEVSSSNRACSSFYPSKKGDKAALTPRKVSGLAEEGYFEAIYHDDKPSFVVKTDTGFRVQDTVNNQGKTTEPKEINEFPYEPYGMYEGPMLSLKELFLKVHDEFDRFLDVDPIWKDFLAACVLLSYQQEKTRTVPYVYFVGDNESGKTVALTLLSKLCYRALFGVSIPPADIYGYLDDSDAPGTILEDEAQGLWKDMDKAKIYKAGYKQGATAPRTFITQHKRFIKYFRVFCLKAAAAEEMPRVKGLLERFIFISMTEGSPKKDWADVDRDDERRLTSLRDLLLKWRLETRETTLPEIELPVRGRLKELWKPVIQVVRGLPVEKDLRLLLDRLQEERMSEKTNTLEGHIVKVVVDLYVPNRPLPFTEVWDSLVTDLEGKLDDKKPNKMDTPEFREITKQKIGYRLREVLGGRKKRLRRPDGLFWAYEFDDAKLRRIAKKYGCSLVLKFSSDSTTRGVSTGARSENDDGNTINSMGKPSGEKIDTPREVESVENSRTTSEELPLDHSAPTIKNETKVNSDTQVKVPSVQEVLEYVRARFVEGTEEEWIRFAVEAGCPADDAGALFERLKGDEVFWHDTPEGKTVWSWVTK